jgi:transcription antitermination factor NusG
MAISSMELIAEIHRTSIWPVVVTVDGNISKPNKTDFIDGDGRYIVLITDGNFKSFAAESLGLDEERDKLTRLCPITPSTSSVCYTYITRPLYVSKFQATTLRSVASQTLLL